MARKNKSDGIEPSTPVYGESSGKTYSGQIKTLTYVTTNLPMSRNYYILKSMFYYLNNYAPLEVEIFSPDNFPKLRVINSRASATDKLELGWWNPDKPYLNIKDMFSNDIRLDNDDERYIVDVTHFMPERDDGDERLNVYEAIKSDEEAEVVNKKFVFQYVPRHIPVEKIAKVDAKFGKYGSCNYSRQNIFSILQKEYCIYIGEKSLKKIDGIVNDEYYQILGYFSKLWDYINFNIWEDDTKSDALYTDVDPKYALVLYLFEAVAYYTESKEVYNNPHFESVYRFINKMIKVFMHCDNPKFKLVNNPDLEHFIAQWKGLTETDDLTFTLFTCIVSRVLLEVQKTAKWVMSEDLPFTNPGKAFDLHLWINLNLPPTKDFDDDTLYSTFSMVKHADSKIRDRSIPIKERREMYLDFINAFRDQNMYMIGLSFYLVTYLMRYDDVLSIPLHIVKENPEEFRRKMLQRCTNGKRDITLYNISSNYTKDIRNKVRLTSSDKVSTFIYLLKRATPLFAAKLKKWFKFYNTIIFIDKVDVGTVDGEIEGAFIVILDKNLKYPYGECDDVAEIIKGCISTSKGEVKIHYVG